MAVRTDPLLRHLYRLLGRSGGDPSGDTVLLERFTRHKDESAFNVLMARHGPMVLGVCRRVLHDLQAAEDAFQATFLVLARKAATLRHPDALAAWLHGTARRLALKSRRTDTRRRDRETRRLANLPPSTATDPLDDLSVREMLLMLDEELQRLPETYRLPLILCGLEGHTQEEAAQLLGWTPGSVKGRLERGRARLHARLVRRGLTLPSALRAGGALAGAPPTVRAGLLMATSRAALTFAAGGHEVSASVRALAEEALRGSAAGPAKIGLFLLLATAAGVGAVAHWMPALGPAEEKGRLPDWPASRDETAVRTDRLGDPLPPGAIVRLGTTRLRPGEDVLRLAFSPHGARLASWTISSTGRPNRLSIWDATTGRELRGVDVPGYGSIDLCWPSDGGGLALLYLVDGERYLWDFTDEKARLPSVAPPPSGKTEGFATTEEDREYDGCYALAPNRQLLAVGRGGWRDDRERSIFLRRITAGRRVKDAENLRELGRQPGNCRALLFTPDSRSLLVFSGPRGEAKEDTLVVWDVASGEKRRRMTVPRPQQQAGSEARAVSPDGNTLALGLADGTARLWDISTGREIHSLRATTEKAPTRWTGVSAVAFSPDGKQLLTGGCDSVLHVWETVSGREVRVLRGHHARVETVAFSPDGKRIASGGQDGQIRLWDSATGADACPLEGHQYILWGVAVSPDGRHAITSGADAAVRVWDLASGRQRRRIEIEGRLSGPFVYTPDGRRLLGSSNSRLRLLDPATGAAVALPKALADQAGGRVHFAPDGKTLVTIHKSEACLWEWPAGRLLRRFPLRPDVAGEVICSGLAFSPDSRNLIALTEPSRPSGPPAASGGFAAADLWDVATGKRSRRLLSSTNRLSDIAFTPDGAGLLLAASYGVYYQEKGRAEPLSLLDPRTGRTRRTFAAPAKETLGGRRMVYALALSPDGRTVASAEKDGLVLLFEVATGLPRRRLLGHRGQVMSLAFTSDGQRLVTGSFDHTGLVWDVSLAALASPPTATPDQLWDDLASLKAERANKALAGLAAAPEVAVPLLRKRLRPADGPTSAAISRLVADLDSDRFKVRQKACDELDRLGEDVVPALRDRIEKGESIEVRRRIEQLLEKHDRGAVDAERVRQSRSLEVLEQIGTPEARDVLAGLAKGAEESPLTREAKACLERTRSR